MSINILLLISHSTKFVFIMSFTAIRIRLLSLKPSRNNKNSDVEKTEFRALTIVIQLIYLLIL